MNSLLWLSRSGRWIIGSERRPQIVAHRGASGYAPESTPASFRLALDQKADFIELDVRMTRDGVPVALHDATLDRTTDGSGPVAEVTLEELKKLDAGAWFRRGFVHRTRRYSGERVPTLQEAIDLTAGSPAGLYIEIKDPELYPPDLEARILSALRRNRFQGRAVLISFSRRSLLKIRALDEKMSTALIVGGLKEDPVEAALSSGASEVTIRHSLLDSRIAREAHRRGLRLSVWTVNRRRGFEHALRLGVDRITTNFPELLKDFLDERFGTRTEES